MQKGNFQLCKVGYTQTTLQQVIAGIKAEMPQLPDLDVLKAIKSALEEMKRPRGQGWQTNTYSWDSPGLQEWIKQGGGYGIVAGSAWEYEGRPVKLFILDADNPPVLAQAGFQDELPRATMRVKTGRADPPGGHIYFISNLSSSKAHYELPGICHFKFYAFRFGYIFSHFNKMGNFPVCIPKRRYYPFY